MKKPLFAIAAAAGALMVATTPAQAETRQERSEARLAERLEGRVAGEPQSCITAYHSNRLEVMPHVGLVYETGDTIYVARAQNPRHLSYNDIPVFERASSRLCKMDVIRTVDRSTQFTTGALFLENFVPYTKVDKG